MSTRETRCIIRVALRVSRAETDACDLRAAAQLKGRCRFVDVLSSAYVRLCICLSAQVVPFLSVLCVDGNLCCASLENDLFVP